MPAYRPTANCIWRSFRASSKKHLILTGSRGSGKSTLLSALFPQPMPGLTSYVVPEDGVYMKENLSGETVQIGRYQADAPGNTNKMQPVPEAFLTKGIEFLDMCIRHPSDWVTIDEIGYLEQTIPAYQEAISRLPIRILLELSLCQRCQHISRTYRIDAYAIRPQLQGHSLGKHIDSSLGGTIAAAKHIAMNPCIRGDINNIACTLDFPTNKSFGILMLASRVLCFKIFLLYPAAFPLPAEF